MCWPFHGRLCRHYPLTDASVCVCGWVGGEGVDWVFIVTDEKAVDLSQPLFFAFPKDDKPYLWPSLFWGNETGIIVFHLLHFPSEAISAVQRHTFQESTLILSVITNLRYWRIITFFIWHCIESYRHLTGTRV